MGQADVLVVGAGLGGLSAAAALAQRGLRVILLERHNVPGGYAQSFVRGRFEFEVSLHELSGIGTAERPGPLYLYLDQLGVARRLEFVHPASLYRTLGPGLDLTLPPGWQAFQAALCGRFPQEARGIQEFLALLRRVDQETAFLSKQLDRAFSPALLLQAPLRCPSLLRYGLAAYGPVLRRYLRQPEAVAALAQLWGYFGLPPDRCSFIYFALGLASYINHGAAYLRGRSQALSNAFVEALEGFGGEARLGCGVRRILSRGGRVSGLVTEAGETIQCERVISNADPLTTATELLDADQLPSRFLRRLAGREVAVSSVNVYLGVARPAAELCLLDHEIFINADLDFEGHFQRAAGLVAPGEVTLTCYNQALPDISPPGTSMLTLTALSQGRAWHQLPSEGYLETKHRLAEAMLQMAEQIAPSLRGSIETIEVSTPLTNMRYAGALGGSIYGFANLPFAHTVFRPPHRGPLEGLYFAGAWTQPGGGFAPAIESGELAARAVLADLSNSRRQVSALSARPLRHLPSAPAGRLAGEAA